jgi:hypothetical protein
MQAKLIAAFAKEALHERLRRAAFERRCSMSTDALQRDGRVELDLSERVQRTTDEAELALARAEFGARRTATTHRPSDAKGGDVVDVK